MRGIKKAILRKVESIPKSSDQSGLHLETSQTLAELFPGLEGETQQPAPNNVSNIFFNLYAFPDITVPELISRCKEGSDRSLDDVLLAFDFIRSSDTLQELFSEHPTEGNFFYKMRTILRKPQQVMRIIKKEPSFPLAIEMHPSLECNLRCSFCYSYSHWYYDQSKTDREPLSVDAWIELVKICATNGVSTISPTGGLEPTMAMEKFLAIMDTSHDLGVNTLVFSNGIHIDTDNPDLIDSIMHSGNFFISVRGATYQTYGMVSGISSEEFNRVMKTISILGAEKQRRGSTTRLGIAYFITPDNYHELGQIVNFAKESGFDEVGLGSDNLVRLPGFSRDDLERLSELINQANSNSGHLFLALNNTLRRISYKGSLPEIYDYHLRSPNTCQNWYMKAAINPFGDFYPCCLLAQPGVSSSRKVVPMGTISTPSDIVKIIEGTRGQTINAHSCETCNPSEYNGLIVVQKLKADYEAGVELSRQPYRT